MRYRIEVWCLATQCTSGRGDKGIAHLAYGPLHAWETIQRQKPGFYWCVSSQPVLAGNTGILYIFLLVFLTKECFVQEENQESWRQVGLVPSFSTFP